MQAVSEALKPEWEEFLIERNICPFCETSRHVFSHKNGEVCCHNCGAVIKTEYSPLVRCAGVGTKGRMDSPVNSLAFGNNMGNPAVNSKFNKTALYSILARNGKENLGIRFIQIKNECMRTQETVITQRIKNYLSSFCKRYGWQNEIILSNALGHAAMWVGATMTLVNNGKNSKNLALGIFYLNVKKLFGLEKACEVAKELEIKKLYIQKAQSLIQLNKLLC